MTTFSALRNRRSLISSIRRSVQQRSTVLALLLAGGVLAQAQTNTGNIRGHVYDETGAIVPDTKVTAVEQGPRREAADKHVGCR